MKPKLLFSMNDRCNFVLFKSIEERKDQLYIRYQKLVLQSAKNIDGRKKLTLVASALMCLLATIRTLTIKECKIDYKKKRKKEIINNSAKEKE